MSEDAGSQKAIFPFERWQQVGGSDVCPCCSNQEWWQFNTENTTSVLQFSTSYVPTYVRACAKCGYIQQFVRDVLDGKVLPPGGNEGNES
jgi:hypothetical protein